MTYLGKKNVMRVPLEAVTFAGLNTKLPPAATSICMRQCMSHEECPKALCKRTLICPLVLGGAEGTAAAAWVVGPAAGGAYPYWGLATARRGRRASENTVDSILKVAVVNDGEQGGDGGGPGMAADWQAVRDSSEGT